MEGSLRAPGAPTGPRGPLRRRRVPPVPRHRVEAPEGHYPGAVPPARSGTMSKLNEEERADMFAHWPAVPPAWMAANNTAPTTTLANEPLTKKAKDRVEAKLDELDRKEGKVPQPERMRSSPETKWYLTPHLAGKVRKGSDNDHSKHRKKHPEWTRPKSKRSTPITKVDKVTPAFVRTPVGERFQLYN